MLVFDLGAHHMGRCKELRDGACQTIAKRHLKKFRHSKKVCSRDSVSAHMENLSSLAIPEF